MINKADVEKALGISIPISSEMQEAIQLWSDIYTNRAHWLKEDIVSLDIASAISSETARLITNGGKSWVSGSVRADYLQEQYSTYMNSIRKDTELACALGGIILKPYVLNKKIKVDAVTADRFYPVSYDSDGELTSAVFIEQQIAGKNVYTRLEYHDFNEAARMCTIQNRAYVSNDLVSLGRECSLKDIYSWRDYTPSIVVRDVNKPFFSYFKMPEANNIDRTSPVGISCFAKATEQIRQADEHWALIMWEYDGSQLAIDAPSSVFKKVNGKFAIPKRMQRLFRQTEIDSIKETTIKEFSPTIRDTSLFNGFNQILQRIEFNCALAYGTLSDHQTVEKTAEEVRSGKERSRLSMQDKQKSLEDALKHLIWIMNEYANYYNLAPAGTYEVNFEWGEGVAVDREREFLQKLQLVTAGLIKAEKLTAWYFGCSEEEAKKYIPVCR